MSTKLFGFREVNASLLAAAEDALRCFIAEGHEDYPEVETLRAAIAWERWIAKRHAPSERVTRANGRHTYEVDQLVEMIVKHRIVARSAEGANRKATKRTESLCKGIASLRKSVAFGDVNADYAPASDPIAEGSAS